jgi:hypothetical protein
MYGPGSVLARIAVEQRQLQQEAEEDFDAAEEQAGEPEQAQVTWPELWDARYKRRETIGQCFSCEVIMLWPSTLTLVGLF